MQLDFSFDQVAGRVAVSFGPNLDPETWGTQPQSRGFPVCEATVERPARGNRALMGWVQLVRSGDNLSRGRDFEIDPLGFLGELPHPFAFLGLNPTMFDVPFREELEDLDWAAHSFLCYPDGGGDQPLAVRPLVGFTWGFTVRDRTVTLVPSSPLPPTAWTEHATALSALYPAWQFPAQ